MDPLKRLSEVFESAEKIIFDDNSKIVLMSDCHRGDGTWADNFAKNQKFYFTALNYYYNNDYTYIEIGDGDELWENRSFTDIVNMHKDVFWLLSKFYREGRLYFIYGNHDMVKKDVEFVENNLYQYFNGRMKEFIPLFNNIKVHEGLVLEHKSTKDKIFLVHGHQVDFLNYDLWKLSRLLVRYLWKPLESVGIRDPVSPAKNYKKKESVDEKLIQWVIQNKHMLIAGHTHRPMFPEIGEPPYFNDGSCVHPRCITAIEIDCGKIKLVKWCMRTKSDGTVFIGRETLAGPERLKDYFVRESNSKEDSKELKYYF